MMDLLLLLVLLAVRTATVYLLPYPPDSNGNCRNSTTEYRHETINLCCKKCAPGYRLKQECSTTADSQCDPCGTDQYMENWNYYPNCQSCAKCKSKKGLEVSETCTPTRNAKCVCRSGMFCDLDVDNQQCTECTKYRSCNPGYRVSVQGTLYSDVKCEKCPTIPCQPPTTAKTTVTVNSNFTTPRGLEESTQLGMAHSSVETTRSKTGQPSSEMVAVITGVAGALFFLIIIFLMLILCKRNWTRGTGNFETKVDANGNCETAEKNGHSISVESQMISSTPVSPEQICLLEKGEVVSDQSLSSSDTDTSTRADGFSSHESLRPLRPTSGLTSVLSEPMALQSMTDPIGAPPNISTKSSSQPTSPLVVSPVTNSPHVNVNITLHIGNGSCGTPSFQPTDFNQAEYTLPFGQEEESVSSPQQEAGKLPFMSVQESPSYCT